MCRQTILETRSGCSTGYCRTGRGQAASKTQNLHLRRCIQAFSKRFMKIIVYCRKGIQPPCLHIRRHLGWFETVDNSTVRRSSVLICLFSSPNVVSLAFETVCDAWAMYQSPHGESQLLQLLKDINHFLLIEQVSFPNMEWSGRGSYRIRLNVVAAEANLFKSPS